jgi:hypothetical protein
MDNFPAPKKWGDVCGNRELIVHLDDALADRRRLASMETFLLTALDDKVRVGVNLAKKPQAGDVE